MSLQELSRARWRIAIALSAIVIFIYFGFVLLVAFNKSLVGTMLAPGLSLGILLGVLVIVAAWGTTWWYVHWANRHLERRIGAVRAGAGEGRRS